MTTNIFSSAGRLYPPYPSEITEKYGFIRRARLCYLYTQSGKRLTDLYQEAGRAILGWDGGNARTIFKNVLNRSAAGSFESEESRRLEKAVQALLPEYTIVRWYSGMPDIPAAGSYAGSSLPQWRPWHYVSPDAESVVFLPPFPLASGCVILAAKSQLHADFPSSTLFAPCLLAGITRSIYDLIQELPLRNETGWSRWDKLLTPYWDRQGPYLYPKMNREDYAKFASTCLDKGVVVSPDYEIPSIVPYKI
jgi:hypothetical protein